MDESVVNDQLIWPLPLLTGVLPEPLLGALDLGGPITWLLLLMSLLALTVALMKLMELALARRGSANVTRAMRHWQAGRRAQAIDELANAGSGVPAVVKVAMQGRASRATDALLREEVQREATGWMVRLRSHLRTLEVIGQISPLLGLFGTVLGMIDAFRQLEQAGSQVNPGVLSGGIWQALLTTGVGLAVAIPVVLVHQWLERRCDAQAHRLEDAVTRVFTSDLHAAPRTAPLPDAGNGRTDSAHAA